MVARILDGQTTWELERDAEGHRTYTTTFIVEADPTDGPGIVLQTAGLPIPGDYWIVDNDVDVWAFCRWNAKIKPLIDREPNRYWSAEFIFSTKPPDLKADRDTQSPSGVEDPLLEPQKVSGSFVKFQEEAFYDRFGEPIVNSAFELQRGPKVEFDEDRQQINIEQNVPLLQLPLISLMSNRVNAFTLWGLPPRCIKLSSIRWDRKFYGHGNVYYTRMFEFDINYNTFDRDILDEGTMVLHGHWDKDSETWVLDNIAGLPPDYLNPSHFIQFKDRKGENSTVTLNGFGLPAGFVVAGNDMYMAMTSVANTGRPLTDITYWLPIVGPFDLPIAEWQSGFDYTTGNLVEWLGTIYISTVDEPAPLIAPDDPLTDNWFPLGSVDLVPEFLGDYDPGTAYQKGQYVRESSTTKTTAGKIHIEKYLEADFVFLGIPLIF